MTTVSIEFSYDGADEIIMDARLGGETKRLVKDVDVDFEVDDGLRFLYLWAVSSAPGPINFTMTMTNAERPNGSSIISDIYTVNYKNKLGIYVPGVAA